MMDISQIIVLDSSFSFQMNVMEAIALIRMILVFILSLGTYTKKRKFWFDKKVTIRPGFEVTCFAIILMSSLQIRGYLPMEIMTSRLYYMLIWLLDVWFVATIVGFGFCNESIDGLKPLFLAIIYAYMGMRSISCYTWLFVCFLALYNVRKKAKVMGVWGAFLLMLAYLSLSIQTIDPMFSKAFSQIGKDFKGGVEIVSNSIEPRE